MRPGLAKIIEKVHISKYFESPEPDLNIAENECCTDYGDTWSSKRLRFPSNSESVHRGTNYHGCWDTLELDTGDA